MIKGSICRYKNKIQPQQQEQQQQDSSYKCHSPQSSWAVLVSTLTPSSLVKSSKQVVRDRDKQTLDGFVRRGVQISTTPPMLLFVFKSYVLFSKKLRLFQIFANFEYRSSSNDSTTSKTAGLSSIYHSWRIDLLKMFHWLPTSLSTSFLFFTLFLALYPPFLPVHLREKWWCP